MISALSSNEIASVPTCAAEISFLIPMYNGLNLTRACLRSLTETVDLNSHELILINDASTDGTTNFLSTLPSQYHIVHNQHRSGYATSMNRGVAIATGKILCLLNNDLIFKPGWLRPMLRAFEQFPDAGIIGNVHMNPTTRRFDHMGVVFAPSGYPVHFGTGFAFRPFRRYTSWQAVTAACCLVKKSVFLAAGGFDEQYKNGFEDIDLCMKLGAMGHRHYVANQSVIGHRVSSSEDRHLFETENARRFQDRWRERIPAILTPRERRRFALNYLLRCLGERSHYRGKKFRHALLTLATGGHCFAKSRK